MNRKKTISLISFGLFLIVLIFVLKYDNLVIDNYIINLFKYKNNLLTNFMKVITLFGSAYVIVPCCIILLFALKNKKNKILMMSNLVIITLLNQLLKRVFRRLRPINGIISEFGYSFPSGHSMVSMAFYGFLIYLLYKSNFKYKNIFIGLLIVLILLIGISRIYLGVHYPTDVFGGFLLSISYLLLFIEISKA